MNLKEMGGTWEGLEGERNNIAIISKMFKLLKNYIFKRKHSLFIFYTFYKRYVYLEPRKNSPGEALC